MGLGREGGDHLDPRLGGGVGLSGASPRATNKRAARTFSAAATCPATDGQTPSFVSAALPYLPAGTELGSAIASLPSPSNFPSGKPGAIVVVTGLSFGATSTSLLPSRSIRVALSISLRCCR
jgi:hypothetical protein